MARHPTYGDHNESRSYRPTPPRGVGLTEPPPTAMVRVDDESLAIPHVVKFEDTKVLTGLPLIEARRKRDTEDRIEWLETKLDRAEAQLAKQADWMRGLVLKIVAGVIALASAYIAGRYGR